MIDRSIPTTDAVMRVVRAGCGNPEMIAYIDGALRFIDEAEDRAATGKPGVDWIANHSAKILANAWRRFPEGEARDLIERCRRYAVGLHSKRRDQIDMDTLAVGQGLIE